MIDAILKMIRDNSLCALSTCSSDRPNTSLMLYLPDESGLNLYMLTREGSLKYRNIVQNAHVSLLIDTRIQASDIHRPIKALTVFGMAAAVSDPSERQAWLSQLLTRHPELAVLAGDPACKLIKVEAVKFSLLKGVDESISVTL